MKTKLPKILTITFLLIFVVQLLVLLFLLVSPGEVVAEEDTALTHTMLVKIPGVPDTITFDRSTQPIAKYIQGVYKYAVGIVGILAAIILMYGGAIWLTAGGNASRVEEAKAWIGAALTGLVLTLTSYTLLFAINPDLVNFTIHEVKEIDSLVTGCCVKDNNYEGKKTEEKCKEDGGTWGGVNSVWSTTQKKCMTPDDMIDEILTDESCPVSGIGLANPNDPNATNLCYMKCGDQIPSTESHYMNEGNSYCCICKYSQEGDVCSKTENCESGLYCFNNRCYDGREGDGCTNDSQCNSGLHCIDTVGDDECYDGSQGDPCDSTADCSGGLTCKGVIFDTCEP